MERWRYGITLLPAIPGHDDPRGEPEVEVALRARQQRGWELVSINERDGSDILMFRKPA